MCVETAPPDDTLEDSSSSVMDVAGADAVRGCDAMREIMREIMKEIYMYVYICMCTKIRGRLRGHSVCVSRTQ